MIVVRDVRELGAGFTSPVVALGKFDGVHRGHAKLLAGVLRLARRDGAPAMAVTFDIHPDSLLRPHQVPPVLTTIEEKTVAIAAAAGIIIADTKMEFGLLNGELILIDELLTPDSSRFWPRDDYEEGRPQKSFDKQFLRDYLLSIHWGQKPPAPELPVEIIEKTAEKYREALNRLVS